MNRDFREFIQSLNDNRVNYLVVGGYAVAFHGHPRYTNDLDVWIECAPENARRLVRALRQFGFSSLGLEETDFGRPDQVIQLGYPPNRIDIMTSASGLDFAACFPARQSVTLMGTEINFIDLDNLKKNKRATGRHQDLVA